MEAIFTMGAAAQAGQRVIVDQRTGLLIPQGSAPVIGEYVPYAISQGDTYDVGLHQVIGDQSTTTMHIDGHEIPGVHDFNLSVQKIESAEEVQPGMRVVTTSLEAIVQVTLLFRGNTHKFAVNGNMMLPG